MKKVYLIRHGLPAFPPGTKMCLGTTDISLGEEGLLQAREMAAKLPPVTAVFSSPLRRAHQTALAIGMPVTVFSGLREFYAGEWDGLTFDEIRRRYPDLYAARAKDLTLPIPGEEDKEAALVRFRCDLEQAAQLAPGDFAAVAHGGIIAKFLESIDGSRYKPDYTEVICLYWKNGQFYTKDQL